MSAILCLCQNDYASSAYNFSLVEGVEGQLLGTFGSVMSGKDVAMGLVLCGMVIISPGKQCLRYC
jgi:hypothetical protein